tara:strand:- start:49 stop:771 length:723 start_codon:yes stop_codon:yes gene_type:complete
MNLSSYYLTFAKNIYSQCGEDGILEELFKDLNIVGGVIVEFGGWDGVFLSNALNLWKTGSFDVISIEANADRSNEAKSIFEKHDDYKTINRTVENLDDILDECSIDCSSVSLISIDVDGADRTILKAIEKYLPKVIVVETNTKPKGEPPHDDLSIALYYALAKDKGYTVVCHTGNAILVRNDLVDYLPDEDYSLDNIEVYDEDVNRLQCLDSHGVLGSEIYWISAEYNELISETKKELLE